MEKGKVGGCVKIEREDDMIKRIEQIENFGIFRKFRWQQGDIDEFKQFNLIYGWNYSGKTTISRIFRSIELGELPSDFVTAEFTLIDEDTNKITQDGLSSQYNFRVFNTDFIKDNLYWDSQEANPIFILGEKDIKLEEKLKNLENKLYQLNELRDKKEKQKSELEREVEKALTEKARDIDRVRPRFTYDTRYDKRKLRRVLKEVEDNFEEYILEEYEVKKCLDILKADKKEKISLLQVEMVSSDLLEKINDSLSKIVVSQAIERLMRDSQLNNWVREGLKIHRGKNRCEFCGSSLPEGLIEEYDKHFSQEYENFLDILNKLRKQIERHKVSVASLPLPDEMRLYPQLEESYKREKEELNKIIKKYATILEKIIRLIDRKIENPFKKITEGTPDIYSQGEEVRDKIDEINKILEKHNRISDKYEEEQKTVFNKLELHYVSEFAKDYNYFRKLEEMEKIHDEIEEMRKQITKKKGEVKSIESQLSDISKAADRINHYLRSIFGKEHLKIEPTEKSKFQIMRNGVKAKNLSEGEKTAVAFSYFLTRLEDRETNLSNAIIFIDDPISSLDSAHLYNTFAVISSKLKSCKQLFVSTHNIEFFNLIRDWMRKMKGNKDKCGFFLIERISRDGEEVAAIKNLPKTLLDYKSEYHFLFSKIKAFDDNPSTDFESLYQLPNIIRRFLEAFVGFKYSKGLNKGLERLIDDESKRIKVDKFVNNLSHQAGLQRNLIFNDLSECKSVVKIVLDAIKRKDPEHYKALEDVFNKAKESGENG